MANALADRARRLLPREGSRLTAFMVLLTVCAPVRPASAEANGVKVAAGRVHPFAEVDSHYITNPERRPSQAPAGSQPINDVMVAARAGLDFDFPSDTLELKMNSSIEFKKYLGIEGEVAKARVESLNTFVGGARISGLFNKGGPVKVLVINDLRRTSDPQPHNVEPLNHWSDTATLNLALTPGGGALQFNVGYSFTYVFYEPKNEGLPNDTRLQNMYKHKPSLRALWKFLPKTAIFFEAEGDITTYPFDKGPDENNIEVTRNKDAKVLQTYLGVDGALSPRISVKLKAGYGNTFIDDSDSLQSFVGAGGVRYNFSEISKFTFDLERSLKPAPIYKYYTNNRATLGFDQIFGGKLTIGAKASYALRNYGKSLIDGTERTGDQTIGFGLRFAYQITEWLSVTLADEFETLISDYTPLTGESVGYTYNDVYLRINGRY